MVLGANLRVLLGSGDEIEAVAASHILAELVIVARKVLVKG